MESYRANQSKSESKWFVCKRLIYNFNPLMINVMKLKLGQCYFCMFSVLILLLFYKAIAVDIKYSQMDWHKSCMDQNYPSAPCIQHHPIKDIQCAPAIEKKGLKISISAPIVINHHIWTWISLEFFFLWKSISQESESQTITWLS